MSSENSAASRHANLLQPTGKKYVRAVGPRLRILLYVVFALVAVIGANSVFLAAVTGLEWVSQRWGDGITYQNHFELSRDYALRVT